MTIILVGQPQLQGLLKKSIHSALHSRILFQFRREAFDDFSTFNEFVIEAFKIGL
jgi:hypothetical protein